MSACRLRHGEPRLTIHQRLDHLVDQPAGDVVRPLAGCCDGRVARLILSTQAGSADPAGDGPSAAGEDRADKEPHQPDGRSAIQG